jgi:vacuolar-type H+-ATPase subunit E/Vma4
MENNAKTDNFLKAIRKHAEKQRNAMRNEAQQLKEEKIRDAENKGKADSERLIQKRLDAKKSEETSKIAKLMQDGQRKLFLERNKMTESVFAKAEEKLISFTNTNEYIEKLLDSAKLIADLFGNESCTLYVNERDLNNADKIKALFGGSTEITADKTIKIGGIKGYCSALRIVADETLDSKLDLQKPWFIENSGLSVL